MEVAQRSWRLVEFTAHTAPVNCLALGHKSGRVLVTGGDDKKVNLWAVGKENCIMSLSGHVTPIESVCFSSTEDMVCAGSRDGLLKVWDLEAAKIVRTLVGHKDCLKSVDFHPYAEFLTSGSVDSFIKLWDVRKKGCIFTYKGHAGAVNSVKFSPDGQWIASGGEDSCVKIWDLRTGRVLHDFKEHTGPILSVEYHPHEFLLASSSTDKTVHFWDLDKFSAISSTEKQSHASRCIRFSEGGECLFAGACDTLNVFGWEPLRSLDTVFTHWGKVRDISTVGNQLIGAGYHADTVTIWVVDLIKVCPIGRPLSPATPFAHGMSIRKSFNKHKPSPKQSSVKHQKAIEEDETDPDEENLADIPDVNDYNAIFSPNRTLNRSPPPLEEPLPPFESEASGINQSVHRVSPPNSAPFLDSAKDLSEISSSGSKERVPKPSHAHSHTSITKINAGAPAYVSRLPAGTLHSPVSASILSTTATTTVSSASSLNNGDAPAFINAPPMSASGGDNRGPRSRTPENPTNAVSLDDFPSEPALSSPRNVRNENGNSIKPSQGYKPDLPPKPKYQLNSRPFQHNTRNIVIKPERKVPDDTVEFIPMSGDTPVGLEPNEFLPKRDSGGNLTEAEIISSVMRGHEDMMRVLINRQRNLQIVLSVWHTKDLKAAIETATDMNDLSVMVDLLGVLTRKPNLLNLDMCNFLLPSIRELLQSKYETYMTVGCDALRLILRNFSHVIRNNIQWSCPTIGVDIPKEERYNKCKNCHNQLVSIRAFLLKRQTVQGKLGQMFRELVILLEAIDAT